MKKLSLFAAAILVAGSLLFTACNDDGGVGGGDSTAKTCKVSVVTDSDGETTTFTFDGNNLVKIVTKDGSDTYTTNFIYENGKLIRVEEDESTSYVLNYQGDDVNRVNITDYVDNELYGYILYNYANGKVSKIDVYESYEAPEKDTLVERYEITYNGNNIKQVDISELGDDGNLEQSGSAQLNSVDDKMNPFYKLPVMFSSDYDDISVLNQNNMTSVSLVTPFGPLPLTFSYEYNEHGYPTTIISTSLGESDTTTLTYNCD